MLAKVLGHYVFYGLAKYASQVDMPALRSGRLVALFEDWGYLGVAPISCYVIYVLIENSKMIWTNGKISPLSSFSKMGFSLSGLHVRIQNGLSEGPNSV